MPDPLCENCKWFTPPKRRDAFGNCRRIRVITWYPDMVLGTDTCAHWRGVEDDAFDIGTIIKRLHNALVAIEAYRRKPDGGFPGEEIQDAISSLRMFLKEGKDGQ